MRGIDRGGQFQFVAITKLCEQRLAPATATDADMLGGQVVRRADAFVSERMPGTQQAGESMT
jgi:hypothetical protein